MISGHIPSLFVNKPLAAIIAAAGYAMLKNSECKQGLTRAAQRQW